MLAADAIQAALTQQRDAAMNEAAKAQAQVLVLEAHVAGLEADLNEARAALMAELQRPKPQE